MEPLLGKAGCPEGLHTPDTTTDNNRHAGIQYAAATGENGSAPPTAMAACAGLTCMQEDAILIDLVQKYGEKRWNMVANGLPGRTGKGCSHRCVLYAAW